MKSLLIPGILFSFSVLVACSGGGDSSANASKGGEEEKLEGVIPQHQLKALEKSKQVDDILKQSEDARRTQIENEEG